MSQMFRQGDVLLVECDLPAGAWSIRRGRNGLILAAGEATGHHHRVKDRHTRLFGFGGRRFIRTCKHGAQVTHEEHDPLVLPAGKAFEVIRQREYNPPKDQQPARPSYVRD